jgi:hypothetical protein
MKHIKRRLTLGLAAFLVALAPLTSVAAPRHTGIQGRAWIYRGPTWDGPPRVAYPAIVYPTFPAQAPFTVRSARTGRVVARGTTDATGAFAVSLPPGTYVFVPGTLADPLAQTRYYTPKPIKVIVQPRQFTMVSFTYIFPFFGIQAFP